MRIKTAVVLGACLAAPQAWASATDGSLQKNDQAGDAQAISNVEQGWVEAWNRHDTQAMAGYFAPGGDLINPMGREAKGREQIAKLLQDDHASTLKSATFSETCETPRFLGADVAAVDCPFTVEGIRGPGAPPKGTMPGLKTVVLTRDAAGWRIAMLRAMSPVRPAAEHASARVAPPLPR